MAGFGIADNNGQQIDITQGREWIGKSVRSIIIQATIIIKFITVTCKLYDNTRVSIASDQKKAGKRGCLVELDGEQSAEVDESLNVDDGDDHFNVSNEFSNEVEVNLEMGDDAGGDVSGNVDGQGEDLADETTKEIYKWLI